MRASRVPVSPVLTQLQQKLGQQVDQALKPLERCTSVAQLKRLARCLGLCEYRQRFSAGYGVTRDKQPGQGAQKFEFYQLEAELEVRCRCALCNHVRKYVHRVRHSANVLVDAL